MIQKCLARDIYILDGLFQRIHAAIQFCPAYLLFIALNQSRSPIAHYCEQHGL